MNEHKILSHDIYVDWELPGANPCKPLLTRVITEALRQEGLDITALSSQLEVRRIKEPGISSVYHLYRDNRKYYRKEQVAFALRGLTDVITDLPDFEEGDKQYFLGFYDEKDELTAVLDLITGYPDDQSAFIGWFMVDADRQRQGIGSQIFADIRASLQALGFSDLSVSVRRNNTDAARFWESQGFAQQADSPAQTEDTLILARKIS